MPAETTPMMRQYNKIKEENPGCVIFFRLGDFYEMFNEDALFVSDMLDLTLTTRDRGVENEEERTPMCGVPYHSAESYIARLVGNGVRVAIVEQTEDPAKAKGIVKREVVRIITPGTVLEPGILDEGKNNYISSVYFENGVMAICTADVSTGDLWATQIDKDDDENNNDESRMRALLRELGRFSPREAILSKNAMALEDLRGFLKERLNCLAQEGNEESFSLEYAEAYVKSHFPETDNLGFEGKDGALIAAGGLLAYISYVYKNDASLVRSINVYDKSGFMELDIGVRRNLELLESLKGEKKGSLFWVLDKTGSSMGTRLLRNWISNPLTNAAEIARRQEAVEEFLKSLIARVEIQKLLKGLPDLERLMSRIISQTANARDLSALSRAAGKVPFIKDWLGAFMSPLNRDNFNMLDDLKDIHERLEAAIVEAPPFSIREGGFIKEGYNSEADRLRSVVKDARETVARMETDLRTQTGIKNLKIGYNKVFGYYFEVTKSQLSQVPESFIRKQTLANCERFITQELKVMEDEILTAGDKLRAVEQDLFEELRLWICSNAHRFQKTSNAIATIDVLCSLAEVAEKNNYCRPEVDYSDVLEIRDGRHPVVEAFTNNELFVPNDTSFSKTCRTMVITGPNMAGKSTYMRQVAIIALMAQIGSFVPAKSARIGITDRIFTRIGAQDDLAGGRSTFMVEMTEVASILNAMTAKSLVIYDEVGRGTSTFDGMSVARAVLEYTHTKYKAKCLFATHYHELTDMEESFPGIKNYNICAKKRDGDIVFLRRIVPGGTDDSFGVEVARLAGLPDSVITRAKAILKDLEAGAPVRAASRALKPKHDDAQISLSAIAERELIDKLKKLDINTFTPIEALGMLNEIASKAKEI